MDICMLLKNKMSEAGILQSQVADRIGWSRQHLSGCLKRPGARFSSMLLIAEAIGLSASIKARDGTEIPASVEEETINAACEQNLSTEQLESVIDAMGCELKLDWWKPGDRRYRLDTAKRDQGE